MFCEFCGATFNPGDETMTIGTMMVCKIHDSEPSHSKESWAMSNPEPAVIAWAAKAWAKPAPVKPSEDFEQLINLMHTIVAVCSEDQDGAPYTGRAKALSKSLMAVIDNPEWWAGA